MGIDYEIIFQGNSLTLRNAALGLSTVVLVTTPEGPLLFDTGQQGTRRAVLEGLGERGLRPADVRTVFLSHLHYDHAGNIDLFSEARVLVSRREWEYAENPHPDDCFIPWLIHEQLGRHRLELIEGEGSLCEGVTYRPAPGHTPGSQALILDTRDKGRVVLAGDAIKYAKEAVGRQSDMVFDTPAASTATIEALLAMADRIVPGHFPELRTTDNGIVWDQAVEVPLLIR